MTRAHGRAAPAVGSGDVKYLEKYGAAVREQGYDICFIRPGEKRPFGNDWEKKKHGPNMLAAALARGHGNFGVGIKAKLNPLADIDCYDEEMVAHMRDFFVDRCGETLERVGMPPKLGMVYRSEKTFRKIQSRVFLDDEGRPNKLEVLGDGQQFVALHIHPDTGKPYRWKDKKHVGNTPRDDLPVLDEEDAVEGVAEFERICRAKGWVEKSTVKRLASRKGDVEYDEDDPFITDVQPIEITPEEFRAKVLMLPNPEDHEQWFHAGMAIWHQTQGSDDGRALWHEWSAQAHNYDQHDLDYRWSTFDVEGKKRQPLTARWILKEVGKEEERIATGEFEEIKEALDEAEDVKAIKLICARIKKVAFDSLLRSTLVSLITTKLKAIGTSMTKSAVAALVRYENPENRNAPPWLEHFVYCQQDEMFYSTKTRQVLSKRAFDDSYNRYMMTKRDQLEGRSSPEHTASHVALNRYTIPFVANRMYLPGEDEIFRINGLDYVNSYSSISVPEVLETLNRRGRLAIKRILGHFEHMFENERDRKLLLSWMAYIVQTNKRVSWAPVIQGAEGDGKTFFFQMMGAALGSGNVKSLNGDALSEQYTSWAENAQLCFIEEVRLHGKDRFAVINKVKPYITNGVVNIRRMRTDFYDVINTMNYLLTTNFKDGVPVRSGDTRYFPIFSRWQHKQALEAFNKENLLYYDELHEALLEMGTIRKFLLEYELHPEFNPAKRAPESSSRNEMVLLNQSEDEEMLDLVLEDTSNPLLTLALLDSASLSTAILDLGGAAPQTSAMNRLLSEAGFTLLGKRIHVSGKARRLWSQTPDRWQKDDGNSDNAAIQKYFAEGGDPI